MYKRILTAIDWTPSTEDQALDLDAELIVLGSRRHGGPAVVFRSSVTDAVSRHAKPVRGIKESPRHATQQKGQQAFEAAAMRGDHAGGPEACRFITGTVSVRADR
jgi:hypothetical protein